MKVYRYKFEELLNKRLLYTINHILPTIKVYLPVKYIIESSQLEKS